MRWLIWHMCSTNDCCFCGEKLFATLDLKTCNQVTLHHIEGAKETDDYTKPCDPRKLLTAHSACHKSYHAIERAKNAGKNYNAGTFRLYEKNVAKALKKASKV